ncbi:hypothetical protein MNBD_PLANCTO02-2542 [hydrothermal vent metagenome]|uniref:HTH marR-type domain-containing protein n=1 Tax=hydrothermal vent metagenome TaxID=652676 RepID=A0A3B1DBJ9_9ZZZZ
MSSQLSDNRHIIPFKTSSQNNRSFSPIEIASLLSASQATSNSYSPEIPSGGKRHDKLAENFLQVAGLIEDHLTSQFSLIGLNAVRFQVLQFIADSAPEGCSQAELATEIGQSESSVSTLIERMRQDRLLYRLKSDTDRRKRVLMLTDEGKELRQIAQHSYSEQMNGLLNRLSFEQQQSLLDVLQFLEEEIHHSVKQKSSPRSSVETEAFRPAA